MLPLVIAKSSLPLLAFSTYPIFYYDICANYIEAEFRKYGYFICCNAPLKGRRITDAEYEISQKSKYRQALDICRFKNEDYYTSAFYMALPKDWKKEFENSMINQDKCI
ncbi:MAG: hypothetical protein F6K22_24790 [Okeania sp. SIO2F4]|uniref:hypothetical protein n=1 Tax=Okeania sp. SIO2F4 TaxID=2607790 RepID=UPI00142BD01A|nr:hypothetical protein [Okeania sp. SIO2F4]NES05744.1 hypothetical protein [Okeania sp. SIO2F4]